MDDRDAAEALRRLRAADPAPDVDGTWADSPASALAHERLAGQDVVIIGDVDGAPRRSIVWPSVAAAAVLAVAVALAAVEVHDGVTTPIAGSSTGAPAASASPDPAPSTAPVTDPKSVTQMLLGTLIDTVPVVPGATEVDSSPSRLLDTPQSEPGSPNYLDRHRFWTAPGTLDEALSYLKAHRPDAFTDGGSMSSDNGRTGEHVEALSWDRPETDFATYLEVQVAVTEIDGGVGIRADAQGIWLPQRDPATLVGDVTSVAVTITRDAGEGNVVPGAPTVQRTLTGTDAQTLARLVDELPVSVLGTVHSCPRMAGDFHDRLDFTTTASTTLEVYATTTGCAGVGLAVPGHAEVALELGNLDTTTLQLLGLPKDYGYH